VKKGLSARRIKQFLTGRLGVKTLNISVMYGGHKSIECWIAGRIACGVAGFLIVIVPIYLLNSCLNRTGKTNRKVEVINNWDDADKQKATPPASAGPESKYSAKLTRQNGRVHLRGSDDLAAMCNLVLELYRVGNVVRLPEKLGDLDNVSREMMFDFIDCGKRREVNKGIYHELEYLIANYGGKIVKRRYFRYYELHLEDRALPTGVISSDAFVENEEAAAICKILSQSKKKNAAKGAHKSTDRAAASPESAVKR
jgi:hypothetical protein